MSTLFEFVNTFLDRYYPIPDASQTLPPEDFMQRGAQFTGTYYPAWMSFSTLEKTVVLVEPVLVSATEDGLQTTGLAGADPVFWVEEQPGIFRSTSENLPANTRMVFKASGGENGDDIRSMVEAGGARLARWTALLLALLGLAFWVVFYILTSDLNSLSFGLPPLAKALLFVPWAILPLTGMTVLFAWLAWRRKYWTRTGRVLYTILALVGLAHVWFLVYWNLLF